MKKLKAVLFDVDGTFADTENQIHLPALIKHLKNSN